MNTVQCKLSLAQIVTLCPDFGDRMADKIDDLTKAITEVIREFSIRRMASTRTDTRTELSRFTRYRLSPHVDRRSMRPKTRTSDSRNADH